MKRQSVKSSQLMEVGWEDGILEVVYSSGKVWAYRGVDEDTAQRIMNGDSPGKVLRETVSRDHLVGVQRQGTNVPDPGESE